MPRISPRIVAIPRTNGSIGPINNDVRFAKNRSAYKDHLLFRFWELASSGSDKKTAATLFVRLGSDSVGFATGAEPRYDADIGIRCDLLFHRAAVARAELIHPVCIGSISSGKRGHRGR